MQSFLDKGPARTAMAISFRVHDRRVRSEIIRRASPPLDLRGRRSTRSSASDLPIDAIAGKQDTHVDEMGGQNRAPKVMVLR
jgi:hypothetical protein